MFSPDNQLMCICGDDKMEWYLDKNIAEKIDEKSFRLKFQPKDNGHAGDIFYLA